MNITEAVNALNTKVTMLTLGSERRARFLEIWCNWLARGYSASQAAEGLVKVYGNQPEGAIARSAHAALSQGLTASDGLRGWFPESLVHAISLYEASGTLVERRHEILERIRSGGSAFNSFVGQVGYGLLLLVIVCIMYITVVHRTLVPSITSIVDPDRWGDDIKTLAGIASFLDSWWWALVAASLGLLLAGSYLLPRWTGPGRALVDHLPGLRWYCHRKGASLLQNMSLLVQAGDSWRSSAQRTMQTESPYGRYYLTRFIDNLAAGQPVGVSLANMGCLDQATSYQITLLQDELDLPLMAEKIAEEHAEDSLKTLKLTAQGIQMFLFALVGGGIVLIFAGSYGILNSVSGTGF